MEQQDKLISSVQNMQIAPNRLDALLALRSFACLMVVVCHCGPPRNSVVYKNYDLTWLLFSSAGGVAVWIFFCLSGYLMGKAFYAKRYTLDVSGVKNFWLNRAIRIFPLYYFAVLILAIFYNPQILAIENWGYLIRTLTFSWDLSLPIGVDGVMWSLATEVQFYLVVPFIYACLRDYTSKRNNILLIALLCFSTVFILRFFVWISFYSQIHTSHAYLAKYWYNPMFMNLDIFLCGLLVNPWIACNKNKIFNHRTSIVSSKAGSFLTQNLKHIAILAIFLLYLLTSYHSYHQELTSLPQPGQADGVRTATSFFIFPPLTAVITSFFIFAFESEPYWDFKKNEKLSFEGVLKNPLRVMEVSGNLSYGLYIWHQPIISKITPIFTSNILIESYYARLIATLSLAILLTSVTYYLVEIPTSKWKTYRSK